MNRLVPILLTFALVELTTPSGEPIYLMRDSLVGILNPVGCEPRARALVSMGTVGICVRETVKEVVEKFRGARDGN